MSLSEAVPPVRRFAKVAFFLALGNSPSKALWLAGHDAPRALRYKAIRLDQLEAAGAAVHSWSELSVADGRIMSRPLGIPIDRKGPSTLGYQTWWALQRRGWEFRVENDLLVARGNGLVLPISTAEECDMATEIFLQGIYDFRLPGRWRVVDIGGNVAMAALFFAAQPWVESVISFEPFGPTAEVFEENLRLNPVAAKKITLRRIGLGAKTQRRSVAYHPQLRGSMSVQGLGSWRQADKPPATVEIELSRARDALAPLIQAEGPPLLAKIDCEGSEYEILRDLESAGALAKFGAMVIEWHEKGPNELVEILMRNGFALNVHRLSPEEATLGLIYATRLTS